MDDAQPESSAVRVALWRALHLEVDGPPPVLDDAVGLTLVQPDDGWRARGDMHPQGTSLFRAAIIARARFIEDLVIEQAARGVDQYVILGAGLDSFAQRRADLLEAGLTVFEIDQPQPQAWKRRRLGEAGYGVPERLRLVPVDFEAGGSWWDELLACGFDPRRPAVVASTGVSMYLSREANAATLRQVAALAPGSTLAMSFSLPMDLVDPALRAGFELSAKGAAAAGTPFVSFFSPAQVIELAHDCGLDDARHVSADDLAARYFAGRGDGLRPLRGEELLVATV